MDRGAIRFVLSGANIMAPGLTSAGGKMDDVPEGTTVAIFAEGNEATWKPRPALMRPASIHAAQPAEWPSLAEALGSLRHDLALRAASGEPADRGLSHFFHHIGKEHALAIGVTLASTATIRSENKGNAIENTLWLNDGLWVMRTGAM